MGKKSVVLLVILVFISLMVDFGKYRLSDNSDFTQNDVKDENKSDEKSNSSNEPINLTILSYYKDFESEANEYHKAHPNVNIKIDVVDYEHIIETALKSIASGSGPDIIVFDSNHIFSLNGNEALQNLLEEPFSAGKYKTGFTEDLWRSVLSYDKKRLIGIPLAINDMITLYRVDIMEQYGFPSEPEALAQYMKKPENWLKIAQTLKLDNKYIASWSTDPLSIYGSATGIFDENLNLLRVDSNFEKAIELSQNIKMKGLSLNDDIYSEAGKQALKDGRLAMVYGGSWLKYSFRNIVPEQQGKWRVAKLPFGVSGFESSNIMSISSTSKHKEEAWNFIKTFELSEKQSYWGGGIPVYLPAVNNIKDFSSKDTFFGGQDLGLFFKDIRQSMKVPVFTPLDNMAMSIWNDKTQSGIANDTNPKDILKQYEEEVNNKLADKKKILLDSSQ